MAAGKSQANSRILPNSLFVLANHWLQGVAKLPKLPLRNRFFVTLSIAKPQLSDYRLERLLQL